MDARNPTTAFQQAELTLRGIVLGAAITVVFMAANLYMGLKTGMTFSSSIPAAMISMGAFRLMGGAGILENNIVQTQASAAGTLCNVVLALPGLVLIGHWHGFPFWQTTAVCALGGLLGVAFSIPLRRALVSGSDLPYPEGVAAAEVLKTGQEEAGGHGLRDLLAAAGLAGAIGFATTGLKVLGDGLSGAISLGGAAFRTGTGFSLALVGVGYLVGIGACLALLTGVVIAWGIAVPVLTALAPDAGKTAGQAAEAVWSEQVRLMGAGIIAVGGLWTVASLARPIAASIRTALSSTGSSLGSDHPREERDLPIAWVGAGALALCVPLALLFGAFAGPAGLGRTLTVLALAATLFTVLFGFLMAAACGYLAGLLGSSSSPISGVGILTTMATALLLPLLLGQVGGPDGERFVTAMALLLTAVIITTASIANDNLQDLKTGQVVGATPWHQQVALIIGVGVGALVIAPLLELLYQAYGFVGAPSREGLDPGSAMAAPQAALMTQIAKGITQGELPWMMVLIGAGLGVVLVAVEAWLRRRDLTFPALTVGIGMYLPLSVEMTIALGGILGWLAERRLRARVPGPERESVLGSARRRGVLLASGFLVGESCVGVLLAGADLMAGHSGALAIAGPGFASTATWLGLAVFLGGLGVYFWLVSAVDAEARV
ncbi:OPT family oligopeptide transporter [Methylobacterium pseudosasicola]|uniref:Putative oligopeptide transporter, OPT family n=1 Tax=Methylobacterium pseudosasicola TaxID=582667 RepID=A0A1I4GQH7_9HYPH|nr:oligopeptide transporter, OPT family [Methylobacterium pseudosasicola]SFL32284.1 putative oligopeptide transporter, OPT family [Methylobacterium pseudosasicola]